MDNKYTMTFDIEDQEYVLLEPGEYEFTVDSIDYGDYDGGPKIPKCGKVIVNMHIDTENGRAFLKNNFYICKEASGMIASFMKSIGLIKEGQRTFTIPNWDSLPGKKGLVKTSQRMYNGNYYNNVDYFVAPKKSAAEKPKASKKKASWDDTEW